MLILWPNAKKGQFKLLKTEACIPLTDKVKMNCLYATL